MAAEIVGKELGPVDQAPGGGGDALGEPMARSSDSTKDVVKVGRRRSGPQGDLCDRHTVSDNSFLQSHGPECSSISLPSQAFLKDKGYVGWGALSLD